MKIAVIGGGVGGYTAAIRAAQLGGQVLLVERSVIGGTCLNRGCIPTKALVKCAHLYSEIGRSADYGITVASRAPDMPAMVARNEQIITKLRTGVEQLLKARKVELIYGNATVLTPTRIRVSPQGGQPGNGGPAEYEVDRIIVATGSEPADLPEYPIDGEWVIDTNQALKLDALPESLAILGAGIIAVEFAAIMQNLGCRVTIVARSKLLRREDPRMVRQITRGLKQAGVTILEGAKVSSHSLGEEGVRLSLEDGQVVQSDMLLVAVGRAINSRGIGLEEAGIDFRRDYVQVNDKMETSVSGIYAIGDLVGEPLLAHVAMAEGKIAAANCLGQDLSMDYGAVPNTIYTIPEASSVGLTADMAKERGIDAKIGRFPYSALGKALADGDSDGWVQIVSDSSTGKIIGGQIVGTNAGDIIHEIAIAIKYGLEPSQIGEMAHQHPSYGEAVMEAAEAVDGLSVHSL